MRNIIEAATCTTEFIRDLRDLGYSDVYEKLKNEVGVKSDRQFNRDYAVLRTLTIDNAEDMDFERLLRYARVWFISLLEDEEQQDMAKEKLELIDELLAD